MTFAQKFSIILYSIVIAQGAVTITYLLLKAKRTTVLYALCLAEFIVVLWLIFGMYENMASSTEELLIAVRFTLFPISMIGGLWLIFALLYAEVLTNKNKIAMLLIMTPLVLTYLPTLTQDYFHYIIVSKSIDNPAITEWGSVFRINFYLTYFYIAVSIAIVYFKEARDRYYSKKKFILIAVAILVPLLVSILTANNIIKSPGFDITPVSFSIMFLLFSFAVMKYRFLNLIPFATSDIFQNTEEAIFIADPNNIIVEYNKTAAAEFGSYMNNENNNEISSIVELLSRLKRVGLDEERFLKLQKQIDLNLHTPLTENIEIKVEGAVVERKRYAFFMKPLRDKKGVIFAKIFLFKDHTEIVKSSRAYERTRISGDIHDSLSNMANVITMNLEYALVHFDNKDDVLKCVNTAYETAKGIRLNLRRILEELSPIDIEKVGLIYALEALFTKVIGAGIELEFFHAGIDDDFISQKRRNYIIYKICMETINNAYFSGKAKKISIVLTCKDAIIKLLISDNGLGCGNIKKGRGLTGIERSVKSLGGTAVFDSPEDGGFVVRVELPLHT